MVSLGQIVDALRATDARVALDPASSGGTTVDGLTHDSRRVRHGDLFACLRGENFDGHDFAASAVAAGASSLLIDHPVAGLDETPRVTVDDTRRRFGVVASEVYGHPSRQMLTVGITGTNGKTTTAQMLTTILEHAGVPTGMMGTLTGTRTTPEAGDLQEQLAGFVRDGRRAAVLEVSSHALELHRVDGTRFAAAVFTNLGRDHLDLHGSDEAYFRAKARLFTEGFADRAVVNVGDPSGRRLADIIRTAGSVPLVPYSADDARRVTTTADHSRFEWRGIDVDLAIGGRFNVTNAIGALTTAVELGIDATIAAAGLVHLPRVPGRFDLVDTESDLEGPAVIVDYAHTPDGLRELLATSRPLVGARGNLLVVFGCGGERDQGKRPEMGRVAAQLADHVVVTSDNPRHEDPRKIIDEIVAGVEERYRSRLTANVDRRAAIATALEMSAPGDVVLIAGKGHERTQDLGNEVVDFDDRSVARDLLEDLL